MKEIKRAANYKRKPSKELKEQIILLLKLKINKPSELAKKYGISKSTISSYLKAKGPMYQPLEDSIFHRLKKRLVMGFQSLSKYKCHRLVKKDIIFYLKTEEFFQNSDNNPFQRLIPKTKQNSQRLRSFKRVLDLGLAYFEYLKTNYPNDSSQEQIDEFMRKESEQPQGGEEPQVQQELYVEKEEFQNEIQNQIQTELLDVSFFLGSQDSYSQISYAY